MNATETTNFGSRFRSSNDTAIEESGLLGTRRGCVNINRYEIIFLIAGIIAAIVTDTLTIIRLSQLSVIKDPDFAYGVLILVNSVFLLLFLITGILYQRISDIIAFFISAVMLTIYVITHYVRRESDPSKSTDAKVRLIRLVFTIVFNICFIPLAIFVIKDYQRDEFSKRLFGAFPAARRPLRTYNTFDCIARINTMLSISTLILNLYNFNEFESIDRVVLGVGIPLTFLWLSIGVGMVRLENSMLVVVFYVISLFQPGFLIYALYSAIQCVTPSPVITPSSTITSTTTTQQNVTLTSISTMITTTEPKTLVPVPDALYVCIGINFLTHILAIIFASLCVRNFGKDLKERVFNNRFDKWFQRRFN